MEEIIFEGIRAGEITKLRFLTATDPTCESCDDKLIEGGFCFFICPKGHMCVKHAMQDFTSEMSDTEKERFLSSFKEWLKDHPEVAL